MMAQRLIVFGAGGHAKVVIESARAAHPGCELVLLDDRPEAVGDELLGARIVGGRSWLDENWSEASVVPALGSNADRYALCEEMRRRGRQLATIVHPSAILSASARLADGCFLAPGAIVNASSRLGPGAIVNTGASVDHDCQVGAAAHIAPGARLCGGVRVGDRTLVGTASAVIPGVNIGADVTIAAGSAVVRDVPDGARMGGCPARALR